MDRPDGAIDAATIGKALRAVPFTPPRPTGDDETSALQQYKKLWHCVVRFGTDAESPGTEHEHQT